VLIGGAPNCGKSVLSYLLSAHLRRHGVAHYLLRAAPDGEGDWFVHNHGNPVVCQIRQSHKGYFTPEFVQQVRATIENRLIPLLVDVGGKPRGEQFGILRACTHAIVLYCEESQRTIWLNWLEESGLAPLAVLRSVQNAPDRIISLTPVLRGDISGLERRGAHTGVTFGALLERLSGIMRYEESQLAGIHLRAAPLPPLLESNLARTLHHGTGVEGTPIWKPEQLPALAALVDAQHYPYGAALYGRGPLWLVAALSWMLYPAPLAVFDVRLGWVMLPTLRSAPCSPLQWELEQREDYVFLSARLNGSFITPDGLWLSSDLPAHTPIVLDGRLPRWAVASLVRALALDRPWVALRDLHDGGAVVVSGASLGQRFAL